MTKRPGRTTVLAGAVVLATLPCASAPTPKDFSAMRRTAPVGTSAALPDPKPSTASERSRPEADVENELARARDRLAKAEARLRSTGADLAAEGLVRADAETRSRLAREELAAASPVSLKEEARGTVVTVRSRGIFAIGEPRLLPEAEARLAPIAEALAQQSDQRIVVEYHTGAPGAEESDPELARARAEAVRVLLVSHGVRWDRLTARGRSEDPRPGSTVTGDRDGHRIEIVVESTRKR